MKPLTVFWIAWHPLCIAANIWSWTRNQEQLSLWCIAGLLLTFTYWINQGRKEHRKHRDMEALIDDMAKQLIAHGGIYMEYKPNLVKPSTKEKR